MKLQLLLVAIVITSLCIQQPAQKAQFGFAESALNPDLHFTVETDEEVRGGRNITVIFDFQNKQGFELDNVNLNVYDMCLFSGDSEKDFELKANRTEKWAWKWASSKPDFETECEIKFRTTYFGHVELSQDIVVLTETEYYSREDAGTLDDITIGSSSQASPISIVISFSADQPFLEGEENLIYITYENVGGGFITELETGEVNITVPDNIKDFSCNDYESQGNKYVLIKPLRFINENAPTSTCSFTGQASQPMDFKTLTLTATYKYALDNSFIVKVKLR